MNKTLYKTHKQHILFRSQTTSNLSVAPCLGHCLVTCCVIACWFGFRCYVTCCWLVRQLCADYWCPFGPLVVTGWEFFVDFEITVGPGSWNLFGCGVTSGPLFDGLWSLFCWCGCHLWATSWWPHPSKKWNLDLCSVWSHPSHMRAHPLLHMASKSCKLHDVSVDGVCVCSKYHGHGHLLSVCAASLSSSIWNARVPHSTNPHPHRLVLSKNVNYSLRSSLKQWSCASTVVTAVIICL